MTDDNRTQGLPPQLSRNCKRSTGNMSVHCICWWLSSLEHFQVTLMRSRHGFQSNLTQL